MPDRLTARTAAAAVIGALAIAAAACGPAPASRPVAKSGAGSGRPGAATSRPPGGATPPCPLTGRPATTGDDRRAPALAVKIDNIPAAMPQAGLDETDLVVEEQVEGGLTRLFAVFQCAGTGTVGPIRSARTSDADLLALLHGGVFAYSGDNPAVMPPIRKVPGVRLMDWGSDPTPFRVDPSRIAPHEVFASTASLLHAAAARGRLAAAPPTLFRYGAADPAAKPARRVSMTWPEASAAWAWHDGAWLRTQDGAPDVLTGSRQVRATDVVVLGVQLTATGLHDVAGNSSPDDVTVGHGQAWVLRDGRIVAGHWKRSTPAAPWTLTDAGGRPLALAPGNTWVELLPDPGSLRVVRR